jgi:hypothetical protein
MTRACAVGCALLVTAQASAAELKPATVAAFNRYVAAAEKQRSSGVPFLWTDGQDAAQRRAREELRLKGFAIERIEIREGNQALAVPDGLVHHWLGVVFVPRATLAQGLALLQDYDRHGEIYKPAVARSRLISRDGDIFKFYLRFFMKKVITVVVNSDHEARFTRHDATRAESRIYSTRIAEVDDPDTSQEREKPVGNDGGYLWRLNSYWRFLERDGGLYLQCESVSLTRGIPLGFGWIVRPFVTSIPRETLTFTLETSRKALLPK